MTERKEIILPLYMVQPLKEHLILFYCGVAVGLGAKSADIKDEQAEAFQKESNAYADGVILKAIEQIESDLPITIKFVDTGTPSPF